MSGPTTEFEQRVNPKDFLGAVKRVHEIKANAQEYIGQLGQHRASQVKLLGLNNQAFSKFLTLDKTEPVKRLDFYRSLLQYALTAGHFKQVDAFDDLNILLERILDETTDEPEQRGDNVVILNDVANG